MKPSALQLARYQYEPKMPKSLKGSFVIKEGENTKSVADNEEIKALFPNTYGMPIVTFEADEKGIKSTKAINVGVILSGGQAAGGHNVIAGLFDGIKAINKDSKLYGFLGGPSGLVDHKYTLLTEETIDAFRNTGGFNIIGSGRTKLETPDQFDKGAQICKELNINAIVIIGGDDSNTNACVLAEYYKAKGIDIQVIGCPKTIDGDLKNELIETSFGFDSACKVYSELIGNIQRDAASAKKYWHFIRLMGRSASHITLECALKTHPNITLIGEEIAAKKITLAALIDSMAEIIVERGNKGINYGTVLVPEGLIEFLPGVGELIGELNDLLAKCPDFATMKEVEQKAFLQNGLTTESAELYFQLPAAIAQQLTLDRDPHGNVQVSLIETEKMLAQMLSTKLAKMKAEGTFKGKFATLSHFFGYEGRCTFPSNFDTDYCYSLGYTASLLISASKSGYMAAVRQLADDSEQWSAAGVPITAMMNVERRHGANKPVIKKALVDLNAAPFKYLVEHRDLWAQSVDTYVFPGPIQFFGPAEVADCRPFTLLLEKGKSID